MDAWKRLDTSTRKLWIHYLIALAGGALFVIPAFAVLIAVLDYLGSMPPPLISNNLCADEKLAFMRNIRPAKVNLLIVGSSSAMRHFNSPEAMRVDPRLRPFNAGLCAMNLWRTEQVTRWLIHRWPDVRRVILIASSLEWGDCRPNARPVLDVPAADRFVFGDKPRITFYMKSFNATTLLRNTIDLRRRRADQTWFDSVVLNKFGDAPVQPKGDRREWYLPPKITDQCLTTLRRTARTLNAQGIQFAVVESPMNPRWREQFDPSGTVTSLMRRRIREALGGTRAMLIEDHNGFTTADFYDAVHMRKSSTPRFTRSVLSEVDGPDRAPPQPSTASNGPKLSQRLARAPQAPAATQRDR